MLDSGFVYDEDNDSVVWAVDRLVLGVLDKVGEVWDIWVRLVKVERDI